MTEKTQTTLYLHGKHWTPKVLSIVIGFDALRTCLGGKPDVFTIREIIKWLESIEETA